MIDLPDSSAFLAAVTDRRFLAAAAVASVSGLVRGFSGFGSALIYVPLIAAVYEPRIAAVTLLLIDFFSALPFTVRLAPRCDWRDVLPVALAAAVAAPFGTMILLAVDPIVLRWSIAVLVLALLAVLAAGWRYQGRPLWPVKLAVGGLAGLSAGAVQISGPPVIVYWLGSRSPADVVRANLMVFFALSGVSVGLVYGLRGLFTPQAIALSLALGPFFVLSMLAGARFFRGASDLAYRRVAYLIVAAAALVSLPLFDGVLR